MYVSDHRNRTVTSRGDTARRSRGEPTESAIRRYQEMAALEQMMQTAPGRDQNNALTDRLDYERGESY